MRHTWIAGKAGNTLLWIMALLLTHTAWSQVTVTVPATCNVVVAGAGGTTGPGGTVGSGGIVVMDDNITGGGTFTVNPGVSTILGWSLAGDLSVDIPPLVPGVDPAVQSVGAGILTADIITYNELLRPSEATPPSSIYLARSKGRVYISYNNPSTTCGGRIEFDIFKEYSSSTYLPPIIGPSCWEADSTYTYSVDQIASDNLGDGIGIDNYYWTVYNGSTYISNFYTSADKSSITLDAPNPVNGPWTITCCFGRANPWDANVSAPTSCVTKAIGVQPPVPLVTIPTCVNIGDAFFNASVPPGSYTYVWSSSNPSWVLTPNLAGDAVTVSALGDGPGIITLTVGNGSCSSSSSSDTVNRSYVAPDVFITGDTCLSADADYTYSVLPTGIQGNPTCWDLPLGWTFSPLNGTESIISVHVPNGTPAGTYTIDAFACACPAGVVSITVYVRPEDPVIVSGDTCIVYGDLTPLTYTVSPAGSYVWTIPAGWSGSSSTETITVTPNGTGVGTITAQGTAPSGCNSLGTASWTINFEPVDPSAATVGCLNFGYNSNTSVLITGAPSPFFGTYTVTSTPGGLLSGPATVNPGTGAILIPISGTATAGSYTLHIVHVTACGTSDTLDVPVTLTALAVTLSPTYTVAYDLYQVSPPIGGAYIWSFDGGGPISPPNNSPVLFLNNPSGYIPTTVCVDVLNSATGCYTRVCAPGGTFGRSAPLAGDDRRPVNEILISPNPNNGHFTIKVPKFNTSASVRVMDGSGHEVGGYKLFAGENRINHEELAAGTYYLLFTIDERVSVQKVQVTGR